MEDVLETHLLNDEIVELCIPGDEVPQRMRYKNQRGSSLSFTLDKPNLIAVSLCLVFNPKNHYCDFVLLTCEAQFIDKSGHNSDFVFDFPHLLAVDGLESKHVCLWNKLFNMEDSFVEASFQFCLYKYSSSLQGAGPYTEALPPRQSLLRSEFKLVVKIVNDVWEKLGCFSSSDSPIDNLVGLESPALGNLKLLDLTSSMKLTRVPDLSRFPNLEVLRLGGCRSLIEIPSSIGELKCLKEIDLLRCFKLHRIPQSICNLKSLTVLGMSDFLNVTELPENIGDLEFLETLEIVRIGIKALPSSINQLENLVSLRCRGCKGLTLPPLTELPSCLIDLSLGNCTSLESASTSFLFPEHKDEDRIENFLDFSNCISLDKEKVMEDVLETHLLKHKIVRLCIPGDEVPQRMRYKNQSGSSLSFTLDQPNLIGVSLCLVFYPKNYYGYYVRFNCEAQFIDKSGHNSKNSKFSFQGHWITDRWNQNMCTFGMNCSTVPTGSLRPNFSSSLKRPRFRTTLNIFHSSHNIIPGYN
ncbi:hypothetical protein GH714_019350 [Hevea brasiliensis]|uniref:Disease resistance R13L4/SHOC-2-like LRR domain-containing protein n=1 Tax=Hevea brasiliensis TaxID=3981 RepID=A0A6A6N317_HEVBR|nr:hypothetical protein GH714_019350 [Hevea brasiliensis]